MNVTATEEGAVSSSAASGDEMIAASGLTKYYGKFIAAEDVSFAVPRGQIVAFLGPNGAGKSTTMKMLTGYLAPTRGAARIAGHDVHQDRLEAARVLGYLPENGPLYTEMTPKGLLHFCGRLRGMSKGKMQERIDFVVNRCSLGSVWEKPIGKLSKGFRQRVGMAQAILHDPEVLILDEPTSGLDPNQTHQARELIRSLGESKTILLSTHILSEVQAVCSRVVMINNGRVIMDGPVSEFAEDVASMETRFRTLTTGKA
ncbi:MAG: ABC transporter ATP-binding protein [Rubinisphaera brasiliensis]|uniref:Sulfate-transporting ATPase n=1 Tax=Rubinisphaera brasiliensis (strain ATCC 49424 / DSM 5305 / JCM 21570 / IAM 15109 / NBRC 103401 / IFAM 1448) TaxID=756272 RepID=F0SSK6_RUBBR|nr:MULTISPECIES: ATP-binding cassette domain-containing protein [Rubinisphaera]ADY60322.1 Sulfate-transporting ATPase [Rubinisphaera brasiliensis DSM 5305]MBB02145.1 multidrug ABC transporter ATP-binding protein [Planctomyces sp.]